jgi:hypothetical protein
MKTWKNAFAFLVVLIGGGSVTLVEGQNDIVEPVFDQFLAMHYIPQMNSLYLVITYTL